MRYLWNRKYRLSDSPVIEELRRKLSTGPLRVPSSFAALLLARGFNTPETIWRILEKKSTWSADDFSDPFLIPDIRKAAERILKAADAGETILLFGDYDADGITSLAVLHNFIRQYFPAVKIHLTQPSRFTEGYGFGNEGVDTAIGFGAKLIITVDCGITSLETADYANQKNMDVIITDHHEPGPVLPAALAVVNPKRPDQTSGFREFAGCGVAFKLVLALVRLAPEKFPAFALAPYLELAAIGSVADIVPLVDENRLIVQAGFLILDTVINGHKGINNGLLALRRKARVLDQKMSSYHAGYVIGPRLNAAGRVEEARIATELLTTDDKDKIEMLAQKLEDLNFERRKTQKELQERVEKKLAEDPEATGHSIIIYSDKDMDEGVRGIVASRIASNHLRPVIIFSIDNEKQTATGSARSIAGFDLYDALSRLERYYLRWGGHQGAAGMTLPLKDLADYTHEARTLFDSLLPPDKLRPRLDIDAPVRPEEVDVHFANLITRLEPFGNGNPEPKFLLENLRILKADVKKGRTGGSDRLCIETISADETTFHSLTLWDPVSLLGEITATNWPGRSADFVVSISANDWNGRTYLNLKVVDLELR